MSGVSRLSLIAELARDMILADVATKADLTIAVAELKTDGANIKREIDGSLRELELRMTVKLGAIIAAAVAAVATLQKFF